MDEERKDLVFIILKSIIVNEYKSNITFEDLTNKLTEKEMDDYLKRAIKIMRTVKK